MTPPMSRLFCTQPAACCRVPRCCSPNFPQYSVRFIASSLTPAAFPGNKKSLSPPVGAKGQVSRYHPNFPTRPADGNPLFGRSMPAYRLHAPDTSEPTLPPPLHASAFSRFFSCILQGSSSRWAAFWSAAPGCSSPPLPHRIPSNSGSLGLPAADTLPFIAFSFVNLFFIIGSVFANVKGILHFLSGNLHFGRYSCRMMRLASSAEMRPFCSAFFT